MSQVVTIDVPTRVVERAQAVALHTHRRMEDVLLEWLGQASTEVSLDLLPDSEIQALADLHMSEPDQVELRILLASQREGTLKPSERERLNSLLDIYRQGMIQKSHALKIAVERGLRSPLSQ